MENLARKKFSNIHRNCDTVTKVVTKIKALLGDFLSHLWGGNHPTDNLKSDWLVSLSPNIPLANPQSKKKKPWEIRLNDKELEVWIRSLNSQTLFMDGASKGNLGVVGGQGFLHPRWHSGNYLLLGCWV